MQTRIRGLYSKSSDIILRADHFCVGFGKISNSVSSRIALRNAGSTLRHLEKPMRPSPARAFPGRVDRHFLSLHVIHFAESEGKRDKDSRASSFSNWPSGNHFAVFRGSRYGRVRCFVEIISIYHLVPVIAHTGYEHDSWSRPTWVFWLYLFSVGIISDARQRQKKEKDKTAIRDVHIAAPFANSDGSSKAGTILHPAQVGRKIISSAIIQESSPQRPHPP